MRIKDLDPRAPVTASPSESLRSAARRLIEEEIGALVVYGSVGPIGIFSERDLARAIADDVDVELEQVKDYMTQAPLLVDQDEAITTGISRMNEFGVRHLIVTEDGDVVGVVSMRDVVRHLDAKVPA